MTKHSFRCGGSACQALAGHSSANERERENDVEFESERDVRILFTRVPGCHHHHVLVVLCSGLRGSGGGCCVAQVALLLLEVAYSEYTLHWVISCTW